MHAPQPQRIHDVLRAIQEDAAWSAEELLPAVYSDLRRMAEAELARLPPGQSVGPTDLVHEVFERLVDAKDGIWENRRHFFFLAARSLRDIVVERQRRNSALKRGGGWQRTDAEPDDFPGEAEASGLFSLGEALERLERDDPVRREIVQMRFFGGLTDKETAAKLGLSLRTVEREWSAIRERLRRELTDEHDAA